ncbi:MAG TPA: hypothetical protein VMZ27_05105, partial [Candidatus Saccharimonadales bacterium]|nr:hypothetical protein [Candidatus Saccharimonadales bacterium]
MSLENSAAQSSASVPPKTQLLQRYWQVPEEGRGEILKTLAVAHESELGLKRFIDGLDVNNLDDVNRLANLWDLIDEEHPEGPSREGHPFR